MGEITLGQIVHSRAGRDKDRYFIVVGIVSSEYVLLADGNLRKIGNPKKKKVKHLVLHDSLALEIKERLKDGKKVLDADLRKCLQSMNLL
ncbi:LSU ribosomal protein L14E [Clostridium cylindrosporum DSM 605]|uniref:LSU ribosomal protein L14E n=2 Tax=Clostridium cylindrosporum TaxID=1495 RepID=A0A0J8D5T7_CLOCY|nr:LSU ribosomal protein L14E [Clostridium cylindrosporum DSM 605]